MHVFGNYEARGHRTSPTCDVMCDDHGDGAVDGDVIPDSFLCPYRFLFLVLF